MSINISCIGNKPEFSNSFSEPITLPARSEVVMNKANITIPYLEMDALQVPSIGIGGDRTQNVLNMVIDGVSASISWKDIFDAYKIYTYDINSANVTEDQFFSGDFEFIPNYGLFVNDVANATNYKMVDLPEVIASAFDTKFLFYNVSVEYNYDYADGEIVTTKNSQGIVTNLGNFSAGEIKQLGNYKKGYSFVATYAPNKQIGDTPTNFTFGGVGTDVSNFTGAGTNTLTSTAAGVNQAWMNQDNTTGLDINGGWWQSTFVYGGTGKAVYGISLEGVGHSSDKYNPIAVSYEPEVFDVGFEFDLVGAVKCYRIIDGQNLNTTPITPNFKPANAKMVFSDNDRFFIQIQRGSLYNGTNEFIINLYQGHNTHNLNSDFTKLVYTARRTLNNPATSPNIGFMTEPNAGHIFKENAYIVRNAQSDSQSDYQKVMNNNGAYYTGTLQTKVLLLDVDGAGGLNDTPLLQSEIWQSYGFNTYNISSDTIQPADDIDGGDIQTSIDSKNNSIKAYYKTNFSSETSYKKLFLSTSDIKDVFILNANSNSLILNRDNRFSVTRLPQQVKVAFINLPVKAFQGEFFSADISNTGLSSGGEQRVIGTIPVPQDIAPTDTQFIIQYEPFNVFYRPINNVEPFQLID